MRLFSQDCISETNRNSEELPEDWNSSEMNDNSPIIKKNELTQEESNLNEK